MSWELSIAGFVVGTIIGMTGIGGGSLMTPVVVLLMGVSPALAIGTNLWFACATKVLGSLRLHALGNVDWQVVRRLWLGSLPTALFLAFGLNNGFIDKSNDALMLQLLGWALLVAALSLCLKRVIARFGRSRRLEAPESFKRIQPLATVLAGVLLGAFVTLTSVGAGSLGGAILIFLYPLRMTPAVLVGTDIVHAVPLTLVAGAGHFWSGNTDLPMLMYLLLGSLPGIFLGVSLSPKIPEALARYLIAAMLTGVALKLLL
jgi:uncharacterized membrane protein YfcA